MDCNISKANLKNAILDPLNGENSNRLEKLENALAFTKLEVQR